MPTSPAISLVKPLPKPGRPCPYCDHVSLADSKFCGACGAALHLMPCPHCGAVNDITTSTACYRCHRELQENTTATLPQPATPIEVEPVAEEPVRSGDHGLQRPHGLVVLIVLLAFAAASYYAFRQRGTLDVREPATTGAEAKGRVNPAGVGGNIVPGTDAGAKGNVGPAAGVGASTAGVPATSGKTEKNPAIPSVPASPAPEKPTAAVRANPAPAPPAISQPNSNRAAVTRNAATPGATPPAASAENQRGRAEAGKGLETPPPRIGPCTEAVAALGLCTPEPTTKR